MQIVQPMCDSVQERLLFCPDLIFHNEEKKAPDGSLHPETHT